MTVKDIIARHGIFAEHNGYKVIPVYKKGDAQAHQEIIRLWQVNKMVAPQMAQERVKQVVFMLVSPADELVGVNSVYIADFSKVKQRETAPEGHFYFYRMFIRPQDRVPQLSFKTLGHTYDYLNTFPATPRPKGLVLVTENPKLKKPGSQRLLQKMGWDVIGRNDNDQIVMKRDFVTVN